jgi:hypothetical protein
MLVLPPVIVFSICAALTIAMRHVAKALGHDQPPLTPMLLARQTRVLNWVVLAFWNTGLLLLQIFGLVEHPWAVAPPVGSLAILAVGAILISDCLMKRPALRWISHESLAGFEPRGVLLVVNSLWAWVIFVHLMIIVGEIANA